MLARTSSRCAFASAALLGIACSNSAATDPRAGSVSASARASSLSANALVPSADDTCTQRTFGKFGDWSTPVNVGSPVNTRDNEYHPAIAANGLSLYFSSNRPGSVPAAAGCVPATGTGSCADDIWVAHRASLDTPWEVPEDLPINTDHADFAPDVSAGAHVLLYTSNRIDGLGMQDIWLSRRDDPRDDLGWETPENLGPDINTPLDENAPTFFRHEETGVIDIFFNSQLRPGGVGDFDIYVSSKHDRDLANLEGDQAFGPGELVPNVNSPQRDTRTAIRHDGLELFITSNRTGSMGLDLWVSTRASTSAPWSTPVNLGSTVNTKFDDGGPALSCDGTTLYFYSTRPGGVGGRDIWVTTRPKL
jgi:hypothetical protein